MKEISRKIFVLGITIFCLVLILSSFSLAVFAASEPFKVHLYGTGVRVNSAVEATSSCPTATCTTDGSLTFGGVIFRALHPGAPTLSQITTLSTMYDIKSGDCGGGAPRFSIFLSSGDVIYVWSGSAGGTWFSPACAPGSWTTTPNLADPSSTYAVASGGPFGGGEGTWANALSGTCPKGGVTCGSLRITEITLDVDGGWAVLGKLQDVLFKSVTINAFVFE